MLIKKASPQFVRLKVITENLINKPYEWCPGSTVRIKNGYLKGRGKPFFLESFLMEDIVADEGSRIYRIRDDIQCLGDKRVLIVKQSYASKLKPFCVMTGFDGYREGNGLIAVSYMSWIKWVLEKEISDAKEKARDG